MILEEIRLQDFRCFHGQGVVQFATDPKKNVTLIYAENGVGKTTLLNALLWCFFGDTTARFEKKEEILNYDAKQEGRTQASVEVCFEHNDNQYVAKRFFTDGGRNAGGETFKIARIEGGHHRPLETPETFINTVIPKDMAGHFLFDGEHAENFSSEDNRSLVRNAVRDILGCTLIETAVEDLKTASTHFRKYISSSSSSQEIEGLSSEIDSLQQQIITAKETLENLEKERVSVDKQIGDIDQKLRDTEHAKHFQRERDSLNQQLERAVKRKEEHEADIFKWLGDNGRFIVSKKLTEETHNYLEQEATRGRIPAPYNEEFVKDLLSSKECICGRPIEPGSKEAEKVSCLLHQAANKIMLDRVIKVRARISDLKSQRKLAPNKLIAAKEKLADENQEISRLEARLGEISTKLKNINFEDIAQREAKRDELKKKLREIDQTIGSFTSNVNDAQNSIKNKERQMDSMAEQDKQTRVFVKRRNLCEKIKGVLEVRLIEEEKQARSVLRSLVKKIMDTASRKNFQVKMSEDYTISLMNKDNITLPKSSGENQLLGLAFTAALIQFAKLRQNAQDKSLLPGTIAPLVLDSPFGQLDRVYKRATSEFIPQMASQVVLLLSQSQGDQEVLDILRPYIGAEYVLVRHNRGEQGERKAETRALGGSNMLITEFESAFDGTEIRKVA